MQVTEARGGVAESGGANAKQSNKRQSREDSAEEPAPRSHVALRAAPRGGPCAEEVSVFVLFNL